MKQINIKFEQDPSLDGIDIVIRAPERDSDVADLIEKLSSASTDSITVTDGNGVLAVIKTSDIVLLSVRGKKVDIMTEKERYTARQSLGSIEEQLRGADFIRISRYEIVNLKKIVRYDFTFGGTLRIELAGGMETWASRRCIPLIRRRLAGKE